MNISTNDLFYSNQYGFRKLHSTELAGLELTDRISKDIDERNVLLAIFMDQSKAFDTLDHQILLKKLHDYVIRSSSKMVFKLSYRATTICWNWRYFFRRVTSYNRRATRFNPGAIIIFYIYMNEIPNVTNQFNFILYADDTNLYNTNTEKSIHTCKWTTGACVWFVSCE